MSAFHKPIRKIREMGIHSILSLSFTAVAGMIFMGLSMFLRFNAANKQLLTENSRNILSGAAYNLNEYLHRIMRISDTVYYHTIKDADLAKDDIFNEIDLLYEENRGDVVSIIVFDSKGEIVSASPLSNLKQNSAPQESDWFLAAERNVENLHFSVPHVQNLFDDPDSAYRWVVTLSRHVQLTRNGVTESGVLIVDMSFAGIGQVCRDTKLSNGGYIYLVNSDGEIIYHPSQQLINVGLAEENNLTAAKYRDGSYSETFNGEKRQVTVKTIGYTGWKLVGVSPDDGGVASSLHLFLFGTSLLLFSAFLMAFVNFRISAHISDPIRRLEQSIKQMEHGLDNIEIVEDGCSEVRHLSRSLNSMISTLRNLMNDIIEQEAQKRRSELDVLQSQINPHFLYNTLDSVIWMIESGRQDDAILMVTSLARLFRISLSRGKNLIPLSDELEHARNYLNIQKIRYKNKFTTKISVQPEAEKLYTLKLIVQPILENAIVHGMAAMDDEGEIYVNAYVEKNSLIIDVADNGSGIPPKIAAALLSEVNVDIKTSGSGIGMRNVHQRIRLTFGDEYGLQIFSEPDEGTIVRISLPAFTEEEANLYKGAAE